MLIRISSVAGAMLALAFASAPASAQVGPEDLEGAWEIVLGKYEEDTPWGGMVFRDDQTGCLSFLGDDGPQYMAIVFSIDDEVVIMQTPEEDEPQEMVIHLAGDDIFVMAQQSSLEYGEFDVEVFKRSEMFATCKELRAFVADLE